MNPATIDALRSAIADAKATDDVGAKVAAIIRALEAVAGDAGDGVGTGSEEAATDLTTNAGAY